MSLSSKPLRLLVLSNIWRGNPSIRYRVQDFIAQLESEGQPFEVSYVDCYSRGLERALNEPRQLKKVLLFAWHIIWLVLRALSKAGRFDLIFVKNYGFPLGGARLERLLLSLFRAPRLLVDFDDGIYLGQNRAQNRLFSWFRDVSSKSRYLVQRADVVIAGNRLIADDLVQLYACPRAKIATIPTVVRAARYFASPEAVQAAKAAEVAPLFIWLGSPHTEKNLQVFAPLLALFDQQLPHRRLVLMGTSPEGSGLPPYPWIHYCSWSEEAEKEWMRRAHFGLNPLVADSFESRKCAFKVVQYFRAGIVPLVSDVGINAEMVAEFGGWTATSPAETLAAISSLLPKLPVEAAAIYRRSETLTIEHFAASFTNLMRESAPLAGD